jgi:hypothetical protein
MTPCDYALVTPVWKYCDMRYDRHTVHPLLVTEILDTCVSLFNVLAKRRRSPAIVSLLCYHLLLRKINPCDHEHGCTEVDSRYTNMHIV